MIASDSSSTSTDIQLAGDSDGVQGCHIDGQFYMDGMQVPNPILTESYCATTTVSRCPETRRDLASCAIALRTRLLV